MWFKNLQLFRLKEPFAHDQEALEQRLAEHRARPCASMDVFTQGWHPPLGNRSEQLCHAANGCLLVCLRREEKLLPAAVVNEELAERLERIEADEGRSPGNREKRQLKDDIFMELLPKAFTRSALTYAYVDTAKGMIVVDAATAKRAEDLVSQLRMTLGSLPATPLSVNQAPAEVMTRWLAGEGMPDDFELMDQCELRDPAEEGGIVRCRRQDLGGEEIRSHLKAGKRAVQIAVEWEERVNGLITEQPAVKRLRFSDVLVEEAADAGGDDALALFDADFTLMTLELRRFIDRLVEVLGGAEEG